MTISTEAVELEDLWEYIPTRASELAGRRVRVTVLSAEAAPDASHDRSFWESSEPEAVFAEQNIAPVTDVDAFLHSLPRADAGAQELWEAVSEDRARRRAAAEALECQLYAFWIPVSPVCS